MPVTIETARAIAAEWIAAWNAHDLDAILLHYAEELELYSPLIPLLQFNDTGIITSRKELRRYFEIGLQRYPDLHFQLHHCFAGINSIVLYYTSVNGRLAAEVFELNEDHKALKVYYHYTTAE